VKSAVAPLVADAPAATTYGSPVFSLILSTGSEPKTPVLSVIVISGSVVWIVVERLVRPAPPMLTRVEVRSTVSPGSRRPLLLPPASYTVLLMKTTYGSVPS
jgi:hypothetical protein